MRTLLCSVLSLGLLLPPSQARAAPQRTEAPPGEPASASEASPGTDDPMSLANDAWSAGEWSEVRRLLEPLVADVAAVAAMPSYERAPLLLLLADGTLNDATLDEAERRTTAAEYLNIQMDADPSWSMLPDVYSKALFDLYVDVSGERNRDEISKCVANVQACKSDVENEQDKLEALSRQHTALQREHAEQKVEVRDRVARSRIFAAIPFGVGQFFNGNRVLGAVFLSAEVGFGGAALGLLVYRIVGDGCRRQRNFQAGSLVCTGTDLNGILRRRKAEEAMAWFFVGSVLLDIVIAQALFKPFEVVDKRLVPRSELDDADDGKPQRPRRQRRPRPTARPSAGASRSGASLGLKIEF